MNSEVIFLVSAIDLEAEMTVRTQILTAKQKKSLKSLKKSIPRSQVVRIIHGDELKKHTMSPNKSRYQFAAVKNCSH